jgi:RNA polymerase sigma factor (sigma-70 family)
MAPSSTPRPPHDSIERTSAATRRSRPHHMTDDGQLLRRYVEERSETAFTELVRRHVNVVYFAALRRVGGDRHLADDVAQSVFADLARKAPTLLDRPVLIGWLYTSTRFAAAQAVRTEQRRRTHEQEAQTMHELNSTPEADWNQLRPILDDAMDELNDQEREIVLLRFFEQLPLAEVGSRFSISTDAARMRVDRALEKLRGLLARRGLASTATALAAVVATQSGLAVPPGMVTKIVGGVLHRTGAAGATTLGVGKIAAGLAAAGLALGLIVYRMDFGRRTPVPPLVVNPADAGVILSPLSADAPNPPAPPAAKLPPLAAVAAVTPVAAPGAFQALPATARDILKNLWSSQEISGRRAGLVVGPHAPNFTNFSAGSAYLRAADLVTPGDLGGIHLTSQGVSFCAAQQAEIDAYPAFYHIEAKPPESFGDLTPPERDVLRALWAVEVAAGLPVGFRTGLRWQPGDPNYANYAAGAELLLAKNLVARGNGGGVHLTLRGLVLCRSHRQELEVRAVAPAAGT